MECTVRLLTKRIEAGDLEYGDVFRHNGRTLTWDGDMYDEDTMWVQETDTYVPFTLDVQEEVEVLHEV
jgi:hypothetical protein